jgi:anti-sigma B factor antagonist
VPSRDGIIVVLRMGGEIDMLNQPELQTALADTLTRRPRHLVVDLAAVTFCWVQGLALLAETAAIATGNGTGYALSGLPAALWRHVNLLWGDAFPTTYRTTAIAVSAIRAGPPSRTRRLSPWPNVRPAPTGVPTGRDGDQRRRPAAGARR